VETLPAAAAVEQLIRDYGRLVFHIIYGQLGDWQESEDLTQEVFLQALRAIDAARASTGAHFQAKAWLIRIAVNVVKMHRRRCRLIQFVPFSQLETEAAGPDAIAEAAAPVQPGGYGTKEGGADPATLVAERDAVRCTLAGMPEALRLPLLLSVVGGFSSAEIAAILDLGEAAIRQRLSRARRQFKERYAGESGDVVRDPVATTEHQSAAPGTAASVRLAVVPQRTSVAAGR